MYNTAMGEQIIAVVQAAIYAVIALTAVFLFIGVLIIFAFISRWFSPKKESVSLVRRRGRSRSEDDDTNTFQEEMLETELETTPEEPEEPPVKPVSPARELPIYEKYPQMYRFEILYWRGVSKPWWWNNYAKELLEYADEYFPQTKVNLFATYNSNSKSADYNNPSYHKRILSLRPKKISKHPLVVINYNQEYIMVDSYPALEAMKDRIDAEWYRHFGFKKTYRDSPTTFTR